MLRTNFQKVLIASVALGMLIFAGIAAALVNSNSQKADRVFEAVTILNDVEQQLLRSITSVIAFMHHHDESQAELASSVRIDLNVFRNTWRKFGEKYAVGYPGISDLFRHPVKIDDEATQFVELGYAILAPAGPAAQNTDYHRMLHIARYKLQEAVAVAQQVAQNDYTRARSRMLRELQISLGAIVVLLLAGIWVVDRMLIASALAKDAAELAARAKSDFLSTMSHEIRTPMSGVLGMAELLQRTELTEKQKLYVSTILGSGQALTTIINEVLDLAKINAGKMTVQTHPFDLEAIVEDVALLLSPRASNKGTELTVRIQPELPTSLIGDAGHIRQVILNLAGNAIKFTKNGTVLIDISGTSENGRARLTIAVEDTGIGIPPNRLRNIFNSFEQVEETDASRLSSGQKRRGTGLGLTISSKLVELMGGEIRVTSVEGEGSRFWFTLTLEIDPDAASDDGAPRDIDGARILVVDDNAINRTVTVEQLRSWSLDPDAVASAQIALKTLREAADSGTPFDLAVLDYKMPSMDGVELAAEIRRDPRIADVPILMLTSIMTSGDEEAFRMNRIDGHLTKPVRASLMLETITGILQRAGARSAREAPAGTGVDPAPVAEPHPRRAGLHPDTQQYPRRHDDRSSHQGSGRR